MDVDPLGSDLLEVEDSADSEFMVRGLPQLSVPCAIITITSKHVLKKAAKKLGVSIHGFDFTSLGGDDITTSVSMDVPPHKGNPLMKRQEFYGEWSRFRIEAEESACMAALAYLKEQGLIAMHDTNFAELEKFKKKYTAEHFWSSILYDRALALQEQMSKPAVVNRIGNPKGSSIGESQSTPPPTATKTPTSVEKGSHAASASRRVLFP